MFHFQFLLLLTSGVTKTMKGIDSTSRRIRERGSPIDAYINTHNSVSHTYCVLRFQNHDQFLPTMERKSCLRGCLYF